MVQQSVLVGSLVPPFLPNVHSMDHRLSRFQDKRVSGGASADRMVVHMWAGVGRRENVARVQQEDLATQDHGVGLLLN